MLVISWLAEDLLAPDKELHSMQLFSYETEQFSKGSSLLG